MSTKRRERTYPAMQGVKVRRTPRGIVVFELDYVADPAKCDPAWAAAMRLKMPSDKEWRREFLRDWTSAAGDAFYPEFGLEPHRFIRRAPLVLDLPVCRGWDLGYRHPACVWFQRAPRSGRVWVLREIMPENIDTHSFRDLVLYLSGQRTLEQLQGRPAALAWVKKIQDDPRLPSPPWFEAPASGPIRWLDFSGPEALKVSATVEGETKERTDKAILEAEGIRLECFSMPISARESVIRRLLHTAPDGFPAVLFDPACPILIEGMNGGIAYPRPTKTNPDPREPDKDGYYEHLHDALGYALVNVVPAVPDAEVRRQPDRTVYQNRRPVVEPGEFQGFDWNEVSGRGW